MEKVNVSAKRREMMLANIQEKMILEKEEERKDRRRRQRHDREEGRDQCIKWKLGGLHYAAGVSYLSQLD